MNAHKQYSNLLKVTNELVEEWQVEPRFPTLQSSMLTMAKHWTLDLKLVGERRIMQYISVYM